MWHCNKNIKMECGILKFAVVWLQGGKKTRCEGIQLPNGEEIGEGDIRNRNILVLWNSIKNVWRNKKEGKRGISEKNNTAFEGSL